MGCYSYKVEPRDLDFTMKSTVLANCDYILQAAGDDADTNGFGVSDLNCGGCSWVLLRMSVELYRRLGQHENFTIRTWVNEVNRMMTNRNMVMQDEAGETVAAAVTQWAIIDTEKRRAVDITSHADFRDKIVSEPSPIALPARIGAFEPIRSEPHRVVYSDIDFNRHVGSVRYISWMFDMLPEDMIVNRELARLDINFLHEARFGQQLKIGYRQEERSLFEVTSEQGNAMCRAMMEWAE